MKLYFRAEVIALNGLKKMKIVTQSLFNRIINSKKIGTKLIITVEEEKLVRTNNQNNYYWLYLNVIAEETGNLPDLLHRLFKKKFLKPKIEVVLGEELVVEPSTKSLSKTEFGEYLDKICALTAVPLPDPEAAGYIKDDKHEIRRGVAINK